jgi:hypothetical protein
MNREQILKKVSDVLDEFDRQRTFGSIELVFRFGKVSTFRKLFTEKVQNERETSRHEQHAEYR